MLPDFLKTIYILIADDQLGTNDQVGVDKKTKRLDRFTGLIKGLTALEKDLDGWTIQITGESNPSNVLKYVQLRPVDLILLDCDFIVPNKQPVATSIEEEWEKLIQIESFMFKENLDSAGIDLYRYLESAKTLWRMSDKDEFQPQLEFDKVLFTYYDLEKIEELSNSRGIRKDIVDLNNIKNKLKSTKDFLKRQDGMLYLKKGIQSITTIIALIKYCKRRIESWYNYPAEKGYLLLHRYIGYKFAHHDWMPEYLQCIPERLNPPEREDKLFSFPEWSIYSSGSEFMIPKNQGGLFFSFPPNRSVENLHPLKNYKGFTINKACSNFIKFLDGSLTDKIDKKIIFNGIAEKEREVYKNRNNVYNIASTGAKKERIKNKPDFNKFKIRFANLEFSSPLWLAATPLTGSTMPGEGSVDHFINKIESLLDLGFGAAVLKTVYPARENDGEWPENNMWQNNQSRCYRDYDGKSLNFYNTGKTANEAFPPEKFNEVLLKISKYRKRQFKDKIIPSLGTHTVDSGDWKKIFSEIFNGIDNKIFPLVEINTRHAIRGLAKEKKIKGDEYFHTITTEKTSVMTKRLSNFYVDFEKWVSLINDLAKDYNKKIIMKFPYRIDLFILLGICNLFNPERDGNICGVTLINTFKTPHILFTDEEDKKDIKDIFNPSDPFHSFNGWHDLIKHPQVSGSSLAPLRNYILDALHDEKFVGDHFKLDISASGGVCSELDIQQCLKLGAESVQIGTSLLDGNMKLQKVKVAELNKCVENIMSKSLGNPYGLIETPIRKSKRKLQTLIILINS